MRTKKHGRREADDVGLAAVRQVELDRQAAALLRVVGDAGIAAAVGDAGGHPHGLVLHVRGGGEAAAVGGERAGQQGALGVRRAVPRVHSRDLVDRVDGLFRERLGSALSMGGPNVKRRAPRVERPCCLTRATALPDRRGWDLVPAADTRDCNVGYESARLSERPDHGLVEALRHGRLGALDARGERRRPRPARWRPGRSGPTTAATSRSSRESPTPMHCSRS